MLTSVAADLVEQGLTVQQAQNLVKNVFSLPSEIDLATLDPVAATEANEPGAAEVFNSMIQVQNTVTQIAHLLDGASTTDIDELSGAAVKAIANQVKEGGKLDLSAPAPIEALIRDAAKEGKAIDPQLQRKSVLDVAEEVAEVVAESNDRIDKAASSNTSADISKEVAKVQTITMGETSDDLLEVTAGTKDIEQAIAENTGSALDDQIKSGVGEDIEVTPGEELEGTRRRDVLTGGDGDDTITGFQGRDILTGGEGSDRFVYDSLLDAGDRITDFEAGSDEIILTELLDRIGYEGDNAIADDYIKFASRGSTTMISIDPDGPDGPGRFRTFIAVEDVSKNALNDPSNFGF
ncbi:MAG: type I secretion C-terminal target domain-containing protein [Okeania sp. SIO2H7]|nr:type I secretion C-terminal target domain-containing protein [Okeania sp. SIO2H7]